MPFGMCNAPASFQAFMDHTMAGLTDNGLVTFFDDLLIYGHTREEVVQRTRECLQRLQDAGLYVKLDKYDFYIRQVSFLGFIIGNGKVEIDLKRVKAVQDWPLPDKKLKHIQEFLEFANFY